MVALLQGNFEKSHKFKENLKREKTHSFDMITKTLIKFFANKFKFMSKNPKNFDHMHTFKAKPND